VHATAGVGALSRVPGGRPAELHRCDWGRGSGMTAQPKAVGPLWIARLKPGKPARGVAATIGLPADWLEAAELAEARMAGVLPGPGFLLFCAPHLYGLARPAVAALVEELHRRQAAARAPGRKKPEVERLVDDGRGARA